MFKGLPWSSPKNSVSGRFWTDEGVVADEGARLPRMGRRQKNPRGIS